MPSQIKIVADEIFYNDMLVARMSEENKHSGAAEKFRNYITKEAYVETYVCRHCREEY